MRARRSSSASPARTRPTASRRFAFFQPDKEAFLEYDIAKLIHELSVAKKPVVGLISDLPIAAGFDPQTRQMREPWAVYQQWSQLFEIKPLTPANLKSIDKDIGVLVIVHPKQLPDDAQYAIDQFVLRGGHLLVFVDPSAELDDSGADPQNPMAAMMADKSSDLPKLFKAWGIQYDPKKVVLDRNRALPISMGEGQAPVRHPAILGFTVDDLNHDEVDDVESRDDQRFVGRILRARQGRQGREADAADPDHGRRDDGDVGAVAHAAGSERAVSGLQGRRRAI